MPGNSNPSDDLRLRPSGHGGGGGGGGGGGAGVGVMSTRLYSQLNAAIAVGHRVARHHGSGHQETDSSAALCPGQCLEPRNLTQ